MILDLLFLAAGLALLVVSADHFVLGAARLATIVALPPIVIGAVVMGFGTSAPELVVSTVAAGQDDLALGVGNVVGSNVANLSLVLATAALVTRMNVGNNALRREAPLSIAATIAFALVVVDGHVSRGEGALLAVGLVGAIAFLIYAGGSNGLDELEKDTTTSREIVRVLLGLAGTVTAAQLVVTGATGVADRWGLSGGFVGFSLVALGTSLPELVTTLAAARRHETELIIGNLLGSNVFNSLAVGGGIGLVGPGLIGDDTLTGPGIALMLIVAVGSFALALRGKFIGRGDGLVLLTLYVVAMVVLGVGDSEDEEPGMGAPAAPVVAVAEATSALAAPISGPASVGSTVLCVTPGAGEEAWTCSID